MAIMDPIHMQECGTPNAKLGEYLEAAPPHNPLPPASRYSPCFLLVVPHSQYTISPVGQGLQGRGIFLHILVLHDIRMNICTNIPPPHERRGYML